MSFLDPPLECTPVHTFWYTYLNWLFQSPPDGFSGSAIGVYPSAHLLVYLFKLFQSPHGFSGSATRVYHSAHLLVYLVKLAVSVPPPRWVFWIRHWSVPQCALSGIPSLTDYFNPPPPDGFSGSATGGYPSPHFLVYLFKQFNSPPPPPRWVFWIRHWRVPQSTPSGMPI